jgi:hypothetical protein
MSVKKLVLDVLNSSTTTILRFFVVEYQRPSKPSSKISISTTKLLTMTFSKIVKVGAVQAEPVWLDLQGSVEKTIGLIEQAGKDGVQVLGFPEVWIPGYPWHDFALLCTSRVLMLTVGPSG